MKTFTGKIISAGMNNYVTILIERYEKHLLYGKILRKNKKIHAFNETRAKVGDSVVIFETRPLSKTVNFKVKAEKENSVEKKEEKPKVKNQIKKVIVKKEK